MSMISQTAACSARCGLGIVQASADGGAWAAFVRIAPEAYVGLAQYRHLEDDPDE